MAVYMFANLVRWSWGGIALIIDILAECFPLGAGDNIYTNPLCGAANTLLKDLKAYFIIS